MVENILSKTMGPCGKITTVDGQNPAPPRMMIIPLFIDFIGFLPSQVVQDFVHQQYYLKSHQFTSEVLPFVRLVFMAGFRKSSEPGCLASRRRCSLKQRGGLQKDGRKGPGNPDGYPFRNGWIPSRELTYPPKMAF